MGELGIDATNKVSPETTRTWGRPIRMSAEVEELATRRWEEYGIRLKS